MTPENRNSAIAAAILLAVFGLGAFYLPTIMLAVGNISTVAAGIIAVLFVAAFFLSSGCAAEASGSGRNNYAATSFFVHIYFDKSYIFRVRIIYEGRLGRTEAHPEHRQARF